MLLFAPVRAVETVGEPASKVSVETRTRWPALPWAQAAGMRNRLVHAYFAIDRDILWNTVVDALPELRAKLEVIQTDN
jgi:uncharacterized protein with HEPN domain